MCIVIVKIWFGITNRQISSNVDGVICPRLSFLDDNLRKCQGILTKFGIALTLRRSGLGLLMGKFRQFLTKLSACDTIMEGSIVLRFYFNT